MTDPMALRARLWRLAEGKTVADASYAVGALVRLSPLFRSEVDQGTGSAPVRFGVPGQALALHAATLVGEARWLGSWSPAIGSPWARGTTPSDLRERTTLADAVRIRDHIASLLALAQASAVGAHPAYVLDGQDVADALREAAGDLLSEAAIMDSLFAPVATTLAQALVTGKALPVSTLASEVAALEDERGWWRLLLRAADLDWRARPERFDALDQGQRSALIGALPAPLPPQAIAGWAPELISAHGVWLDLAEPAPEEAVSGEQEAPSAIHDLVAALELDMAEIAARLDWAPGGTLARSVDPYVEATLDRCEVDSARVRAALTARSDRRATPSIETQLDDIEAFVRELRRRSRQLEPAPRAPLLQDALDLLQDQLRRSASVGDADDRDFAGMATMIEQRREALLVAPAAALGSSETAILQFGRWLRRSRAAVVTELLQAASTVALAAFAASDDPLPGLEAVAADRMILFCRRELGELSLRRDGRVVLLEWEGTSALLMRIEASPPLRALLCRESPSAAAPDWVVDGPLDRLRLFFDNGEVEQIVLDD